MEHSSVNSFSKQKRAEEHRGSGIRRNYKLYEQTLRDFISSAKVSNGYIRMSIIFRVIMIVAISKLKSADQC